MSGQLEAPRAAPPHSSAEAPPEARHLAELLNRAGTGDRRAFADFYDATVSRAFGLALTVTRNRSDAEDVVQEVYREIWRRSASFGGQHGSALSWVLTPVHQKAVARARSSDLGRSASPGDPLKHSGNAGVALSQVPAPERKALELAYFGGYTHGYIDEMGRLPRNTSKARIREGLIELRDRMCMVQEASPSQ